MSETGHGDRPAAVSEITVRPLDAYAALKYLRTRPDVKPDRIGIQGWSNGGSMPTTRLARSITRRREDVILRRSSGN